MKPKARIRTLGHSSFTPVFNPVAAMILGAFRNNNALNDILDQYAVLIEDYKRLKSDYEEEREGRER
ncbi:hypothetical protein FOC1_g10001080 [Fusarium oxysporum f. sp. cubense race 1]|uniref:Uncharacterized protein n=1 Tax=Fusarium oxysporum f. sp. cubense (strain race 1) TaxID=1229664 RepID=N4U885_FUSC1|nr:hypothetical protein FOC1_g10001080 [Fusarium oxysporum f. sp. cubense race 1]